MAGFRSSDNVGDHLFALLDEYKTMMLPTKSVVVMGDILDEGFII